MKPKLPRLLLWQDKCCDEEFLDDPIGKRLFDLYVESVSGVNIIYPAFRIMNEVPGLTVWMIEDSPFYFPSSCTLKITFENKGGFDHKTKDFSDRKKLLAFMETELGGMTLSTNGKSFTFPAFKTPNELVMKLKLRGTIPL